MSEIARREIWLKLAKIVRINLDKSDKMCYYNVIRNMKKIRLIRQTELLQKWGESYSHP